MGQDARMTFSNACSLVTDRRGMFVFSQGGNALRMFNASTRSVQQIPASTLLSELGSILDDEEAADFKVIADGKPLHSIKALLSKRSSYFRSMLDSNMKEKTSNELTLDDSYSYYAVRTVLNFIHTDMLDLQDDSAVEVLKLADMWALPRLKAICESCIVDRMKPATVCAFLTAAHDHHADELRQECLLYIGNHYGAIREQKDGGFELLDKQTLLEIMQMVRI
jgi:speckle-type POZ protein